ncbi:MAG: phage baseplate assembly protein V [Kofleriaceae bacterium]
MDHGAHATRDAALGGLAYGVVTQNQDPEGLGRIKVSLPWLDAGDRDQAHWASWAVPMEGPKFGWYAMPDVGDVVALAFVDGDVRHPVVLGGVWSKADAPPEVSEDGKNNFRGYRSRTGHRLILDDSAKVKVVFADRTTKNVIGIGQFAADGTGPNKCAVYKPPKAGDAGVAMASMEGDLRVACPQGTLTLDAGGHLKVTATDAVVIKAGGALSAEAKTVKINSSAPGNYQGALVQIA